MVLRLGRGISMDVCRCWWSADKLGLLGNGLPMTGHHVCASIVHHKFYTYVASLSGPNDHSPIYTACYTIY